MPETDYDGSETFQKAPCWYSCHIVACEKRAARLNLIGQKPSLHFFSAPAFELPNPLHSTQSQVPADDVTESGAPLSLLCPAAPPHHHEK